VLGAGELVGPAEDAGAPLLDLGAPVAGAVTLGAALLALDAPLEAGAEDSEPEPELVAAGAESVTPTLAQRV